MAGCPTTPCCTVDVGESSTFGPPESQERLRNEELLEAGLGGDWVLVAVFGPPIQPGLSE
jgi:hypothetical protein